MTQPMGTGAVQNTATPADATFTAFAKGIAQAPPTVREKLAAQLKRAGLYKGKISSEFDNKFYDALLRAEQERIKLAPIIDVSDRFSFIQQLSEKAETGPDGGPKTVTARVISEPVDLFDEINAVTREYLGRELPDVAKKKLAKKYIAMQKAGKLDISTTYTEDGSFRQTTGGGIEPSQFFIEEISNSDEGRANKALQGYNIILGMLGGLR